MSVLRLRVLKRHASIEEGVDTFFKTEFYNRDGRPDTRLSVFDVEPDRLVQTHAEFAVGLLSPPCSTQRGGVSLDGCDDSFTVETNPGATSFEYTRTRHAELVFMRDADVRRVAEKLYAERTGRRRSSTRGEVLAYGAARLAANDQEWVAVCAMKPKWQKELAKASTKTAPAAGSGSASTPPSDVAAAPAPDDDAR